MNAPSGADSPQIRTAKFRKAVAPDRSVPRDVPVATLLCGGDGQHRAPQIPRNAQSADERDGPDIERFYGHRLDITACRPPLTRFHSGGNVGTVSPRQGAPYVWQYGSAA